MTVSAEGRRAIVYVATLGCVAAAAAAAGPMPDARTLGGLVIAYAAALVFPVLVDPTTGRRCSVAGTAPIAMGFVLPTSWAILATWAGALVAGLHIRRYRTTPGGMAFGSSWVTLSTAAALVAQGQVPVASVWGCVLATAAHGAAGHVSASAIKRFAARRMAIYGRLLDIDVTALVTLSLGAAAGYLALVGGPAALLLFVVPYFTVVLGGSSRAVAAAQNTRLHALLSITDRARRGTSIDEVEAGLTEDLTGLFGAPVRLGSPPTEGEIGALFPTPDDPQRWLVAQRRTGPPTWQGRYRPEERHILETAAAVGAAVIESVHLVEHIRHLASHDPLTGLANRRFLDELLTRRVAEGRRHQRRLGVLVIDLDHFKRVNDVLGHVAADGVLVQTADRLRETCRAEDITARWGGEEFVVVAELTSTDSLTAVAERLCAALRCSWPTPGGHLAITASVGAAEWPAHADDVHEVLRLADDAALRAKRDGRNRAVLATPGEIVTLTPVS